MKKFELVDVNQVRSQRAGHHLTSTKSVLTTTLSPLSPLTPSKLSRKFELVDDNQLNSKCIVFDFRSRSVYDVQILTSSQDLDIFILNFWLTKNCEFIADTQIFAERLCEWFFQFRKFKFWQNFSEKFVLIDVLDVFIVYWQKIAIFYRWHTGFCLTVRNSSASKV